jgi:AraC family transcriptional regulator
MNTKEKSKQEYLARINRVMDYIDKNISQPIDLASIAEVAHFSPYHFHRIFTFLTGETLNNYIQRIRIEKAAQYLNDQKELSISEIADKCGFGSASLFSRTFRKHFNTSAKEFRQIEKAMYSVNGLRYSKNGQLISKNNQPIPGFESQLCSVELKQLIIMNTNIEVKEMPEMHVIYCRHTGAFNQIGKAYEKLAKWAGPRGLLNFPETKTITVYHDDPAVTDIEKVRQSACITVDANAKGEGEFGKMTINKGKYAVGRFEISVLEFEQAWNTMCLWFTESGYEPGNENSYELYYNDHTQHPEKKFILDICIPVKQL